MKGLIRSSTVFLAVAVISGCTSMTEGEFNTLQATVGGSPSVKRDAINDCVAKEKRVPLSKKKEIASIFNISLSRYETTYCNRLFNAFARGRITYADYRNLSSSTADNSKIIRIMQGK
jgi:hypothetical protein